MKEGRKTVRFDPYEEGAVIDGLNRIRTERLEKGECTEFVGDLMLKIIRAPARKGKVRDEAR